MTTQEERTFSEEGTCDKGVGGGLAVVPPLFGGVVTPIYGMVNVGHPG